MGYNTASAEWPLTPIPTETKALMDKFFNLMDDDIKSVGDKLADEIFFRNGTMIAPGGTAKGSEEIRKSRVDAWKVVKKRRHEVVRVYSRDAEGKDVLLIGTAEMGLANGKEIKGDFTARMVFADDNGTEKLKLYQVWADSGALHKALAED